MFIDDFIIWDDECGGDVIILGEWNEGGSWIVSVCYLKGGLDSGRFVGYIFVWIGIVGGRFEIYFS